LAILAHGALTFANTLCVSLPFDAVFFFAPCGFFVAVQFFDVPLFSTSNYKIFWNKCKVIYNVVNLQ
jgi:hypothetical protein